MLVEIYSDQFRTKRIKFHESLNVILGDENATNSIGKSTLLMVIDFAFGGNSLLGHNKDLVEELGHQNYLCSFEFDGEIYRFRRGTNQPDIIYKCNQIDETTLPITLAEYTAFLKAAYKINNEDISFRDLVSLYSRVWGKDNLNVKKPLHIVQTKSGKDCVNNLIKTYQRYGSIKELTEDLNTKEEEKNALKGAFKSHIIPKIGKREHKANEDKIDQIEREIDDIKVNLAKYATNIAEVVNKEVLELKIQKDELLFIKQTLESKQVRVKRNISENRHIKSRYFDGVIKFFPEIDIQRLATIEEFHNGVARLLKVELRTAEKDLEEQLFRIESEISKIDSQMSNTLASIDKPTMIVDRVYALSNSWNNAKSENNYFESEVTLGNTIKLIKQSLSDEKAKVLELIQMVINEGLRQIVTSVFGPERKSPIIKLAENNYSYEVFEDTGTGTAYASLIVLDLTVFGTTTLPFVAHDSLLFKNIENDSVANLFKVYVSNKKQSFVAIDEIDKYGLETSTLLRSRRVIQLDNDNVLYIKDWRR